MGKGNVNEVTTARGNLQLPDQVGVSHALGCASPDFRFHASDTDQKGVLTMSSNHT